MSDRTKRRYLRQPETCSTEGCDRSCKAREMCLMHYKRWRNHGTPTPRFRGEVVDGKRACPSCDRDTPIAEFGRSSCLDCQRAKLRDRAAANYIPVATWQATCLVCGAEFAATKRQNLHCSTACKRSGEHKRNWKHVQARRARQRAATTENFHAREIYERDTWICGLCGDPLDREKRAPHPRSPSIDHIVPLVLGGDHSRANTQAAHLGCNVRKGSRLIAKVG